MDKESQKRFTSIVSLDVQGLSDDDILFLRARSSYLTPSQRRKFDSVLYDEPSEKQPGKLAEPLKKSNDTPESRPRTRKQLWKKAKEMGIELKRDYTAAQIQALITQKQMDDEAEKEDAELKAQADDDIHEALVKSTRCPEYRTAA